MSPSSPPPATDRSGDPLWGLLVGCYVGLLGTPLGIVAVAHLATEDAAVLYGTALASGTVLTGLVWWTVGSRPGTAIRFGATRARWLAAVFPVPYALGGFASLETTGGVGVLGFFAGLGAMALGFVLGVMARTRHTDAVLDGVEIDADFDAGWPATDRRRLGIGAATLVVVSSVCVVAGLLADRILVQLAGQLLLPVGFVLYTSTETRRYTVSSAGLEQRLPVARRLTPWAAFDGSTRTDEALVLHRPWRFDTRFALADLDDPDAVEAAIARYLPEA